MGVLLGGQPCRKGLTELEVAEIEQLAQLFDLPFIYFLAHEVGWRQ